ncbi:hypothetical protein K466DRAFT_636453 [Polyporus arcularius HHB13444]|uniref:C2H2-type domain-containing protein n=1 Tax=Polyporus arcularius HHB13444 TaxID=1314778 RepID=A0A5C3NTN9_9APHY|nr:hypothetical protein K466DRAFT_636453 [Polyporus arcularius HHB13444]
MSHISDPSASSCDVEQIISAFALLDPDEVAEMIALLQNELDRAITPTNQWTEDASTNRQMELSQGSLLSTPYLSYMPSTTPTLVSDYFYSPAVTAYDAPTPRSDSTLIASPGGRDSPIEKTANGAQLHRVPQQTRSEHRPGYEFQLSVPNDGATALHADRELPMHVRLPAASSAHDSWNGEQQLRGLAVVPYHPSHSHSLDVGVGVDTSAVASTSTNVLASDVPVVHGGQKGRKRKARETSELKDPGVKPKKPKPYSCDREGCSYASDRTYNVKQHIKGVHLRLRPFKCLAQGCTKAFGRNYDMRAHYQSFHTDLPSLRSLRGESEKAAETQK